MSLGIHRGLVPVNSVDTKIGGVNSVNSVDTKIQVPYIKWYRTLSPLHSQFICGYRWPTVVRKECSLVLSVLLDPNANPKRWTGSRFIVLGQRCGNRHREVMGLACDHTASVWMCEASVQLTSLQLYHYMLSPYPSLCQETEAEAGHVGGRWGHHPGASPFSSSWAELPACRHLNMGGVYSHSSSGNPRNLRLCPE